MMYTMTCYKFHRKCGDRVTILNQNLTAIRNFVEFNHGLILSAQPLENDVLFEVRIDRKVNVWNGSLEIGVTTLDPDVVELPATATKLRNTAWILSGNSIVKDGMTVLNTNWPEMDSLQEGDCIAVSRTKKAELMFYINGSCLGVAAKDLPERLFAVIDLYGQCVQVSIVPNSNYVTTAMDMPFQSTTSEPEAGTSTAHQETIIEMPVPVPTLPVASEIRFHPRCGILVNLSNNNKSAERARPLDDYNNGVVITNRTLRYDEFFEIRIDKLVDKWSGSIEVGVTTHDPSTIRFPSTMTNMDSGTIMMSGCKILLNGQAACMEYGTINLDELKEGDTIGMMRRTDGTLHYFINGVDQGVANDTPCLWPDIYGVIDLYGMTVKVSVVDYSDEDSHFAENLGISTTQDAQSTVPVQYDNEIVEYDNSNPNPVQAPTNEEVLSVCSEARNTEETNPPEEPPNIAGFEDEGQLLFHTLRDSHVIITNNGRTAHRPNAFEVFNNGFVMTNRTLKTNELFQVRLDLVIPKWAGSIEIGITRFSANDIVLPFRMHITSGTWCMVIEDVIRDGSIIIPQYVRNLSRLVEGDTVGVMRKEMGILHFFVNGVDQGPAAFNIPEHVFGIIDLYGRVAQATIVDHSMNLQPSSPESPTSLCSVATVLPEMCFHRLHGHNARLSRNRLIASRATVYSEFNDAVLFSSRPLRECDMFEIRIDKMVDCWIGSLEIGVTAIRPDDLETHGGLSVLAGTATDLGWNTYILSGSAMMKDGECIRSGYPLDLDTLTVGSRVGMMWHADRSLHYYLDGMDLGKAWYVPHLNIYAVVDLYGQCTQVTIMQNEQRAFNYNGCNADHSIANPRTLPTPPPPYWSFSEYRGDNVLLSKDLTRARRITPDPMGGLVFSSTHLIVNELFEIMIVECKDSFAGSFRIGVTDINVLNANINRSLPLCCSWLPYFTAYIDGKYIKYSRPGPTRVKNLRAFTPNMDWLRPGDRIGLKKTEDSNVLVYYNSELVDTAFEKVPDKVYVMMEMYGKITKIQAVSRGINVVPRPQLTIPNDNQQLAGPSGLTIPKTPDQTPPVMLESDETSEIAEEQCEAPPTPPQSDLPDDQVQLDSEITDSSEEENAFAMPDSSESVPAEDISLSNMPEVQKNRSARPYTFHFITGNNIRLCSSDTVAFRYKGYGDGVALASQPLERGTSLRFRVDRMSDEWEGTIALGAVAMLPTEALPSNALYFNDPCWVVTNDIIYNCGVYTRSAIGQVLEEICENSVVTLRFRNNSDLVLEIDGDYQGVIANIPIRDIYPFIDLYGKVFQVSILLHPHVIIGGTSLDLPMIEERQAESPVEEVESDSEPVAQGCVDAYTYYNTTRELVIDDDYDYGTASSSDETDGDHIYRPPERILSGCDTHSEYEYQSSVVASAADESDSIENSRDTSDDKIDSNSFVEVEEVVHQQYEPQPGPSSAPDDPEFVLFTKHAMNFEIRARSWPPKASLRQMLPEDDSIIADNDLAAEFCGLKVSQSTLLLPENGQVTEEGSDNEELSSGNLMPHILGSHYFDDSDSPDEIEETCDTNIRHNDRYPEANVNDLCDSSHDNEGLDVSDDNFDNVFLDAMFLETSNMPDLNEDQSPSFDDSTTTQQNDSFLGLTIGNLHYLKNVVLDLGSKATPVDPSFWVFYAHTNGNCEVMHEAMKFWNHLVAPYQDMRDVVSHGKVYCFCENCAPNASSQYSGWVHVERESKDPLCQPVQGYWHVVRSTVDSALALNDVNAEKRRPRDILTVLSKSPVVADTWIDDEGKPHQAALALDLDIGHDDPKDDRLLGYWIYLRSHASILLEAEDVEDTVGDTIDDIEQDGIEDIVEDAFDDIDALLDDDEENTGEAAVALLDDTNDLDDVQSGTELSLGETDE